MYPWWLRQLRICLQCRRPRFDPWVGKIPWRRRWQSTPVPLPGKSHGQRSLVGCRTWSRKESGTTERLHNRVQRVVLVVQRVKRLLRCRRPGFEPSVGKIPWRREWQQEYSSILAWRVPWTEEPGGLRSTGLQRVGHD